MSLRVVGAGLGRTGTSSLKLALEQLLGGPCYHMTEVFSNPDHIGAWRAAANGRNPDWGTMLRAYRATLDWPAASFWRELSLAFPRSVVLLSLRDPESWWESVRGTIFHPQNYIGRRADWRAMWIDVVSHRFTSRLIEKQTCIDAFNRHNEQVRLGVDAERLVEWSVGDGWEPLCKALDLPVPAVDFPHVNTRREFLQSKTSRLPSH